MRTYSLDSVIPLLDDVGGPMALSIADPSSIQYQSAYNANRASIMEMETWHGRNANHLLSTSIASPGTG